MLDAIAQQGTLPGLLPDTGQDGRQPSGAPVHRPRAGCRSLLPESPGVASISMRSSVSVCSKAWISAEKAPDKDRLALRTAALGAGVDQIGNRLGLGQVHLVVEERALGEFAGLASRRCCPA
jgi:hypothetical protein